jgi:hypothetical protein
MNRKLTPHLPHQRAPVNTPTAPAKPLAVPSVRRTAWRIDRARWCPDLRQPERTGKRQFVPLAVFGIEKEPSSLNPKLKTKNASAVRISR